MNLVGTIKVVKRLYHKKSECYGTTEVQHNRFWVRISKECLKNADKFVETVLHELLHLWLFICCAALGRVWSERKQHRLINPVVILACRLLRKGLKDD